MLLARTRLAITCSHHYDLVVVNYNVAFFLFSVGCIDGVDLGRFTCRLAVKSLRCVADCRNSLILHMPLETASMTDYPSIRACNRARITTNVKQTRCVIPLSQHSLRGTATTTTTAAHIRSLPNDDVVHGDILTVSVLLLLSVIHNYNNYIKKWKY